LLTPESDRRGVYEEAIKNKYSVSITGRSAAVWKSFGLKVDININSREQKFKVEDIFYEDIVKEIPNYKVPTHKLQERYDFIKQQMRQMI